jgi:cytochrome c551/c552
MIAALALPGAAAWAQEREVLERTHGCRSPEESHRFWSLVKADNKEAAAKYSNEKRCRIFAEGEKVAIVDPIPTAHVNGVRAKDDPNTYYVPSRHAR